MSFTTLSIADVRQTALETTEPPARLPRDPIAFRFSGTATEYFRIWAVNTALSVLTLGIYSAWAKVRRTRYFYANTFVDGAAFTYHASPVAILKGRVVMVVVLLALAILQQVAPVLGSLLYLGLGVLSPFLLIRAFEFRNRNSSYRGIRFGFDATLGDAWAAYVWPGFLLLPTFGLAVPYAAFKQKAFAVEHATFGSTRFGLLADWASFYGVAARAVGLFLVALLPAAGVLFLSGLVIVSLVDTVDPDGPAAMVFSFGMLLLLGAALTGSYVYFQTRTTNLILNATSVGDHRLASTLRARDVLWLYATNLGAIAATLGLAIPWARIRLARYRAEHLHLLADGELDTFVAGEREQVKAVASELAEGLGFDLGI